MEDDICLQVYEGLFSSLETEQEKVSEKRFKLAILTEPEYDIESEVDLHSLY